MRTQYHHSTQFKHKTERVAHFRARLQRAIFGDDNILPQHQRNTEAVHTSTFTFTPEQPQQQPPQQQQPQQQPPQQLPPAVHPGTYTYTLPFKPRFQPAKPKHSSEQPTAVKNLRRSPSLFS